MSREDVRSLRLVSTESLEHYFGHNRTWKSEFLTLDFTRFSKKLITVLITFFALTWYLGEVTPKDTFLVLMEFVKMLRQCCVTEMERFLMLLRMKTLLPPMLIMKPWCLSARKWCSQCCKSWNTRHEGIVFKVTLEEGHQKFSLFSNTS